MNDLSSVSLKKKPTLVGPSLTRAMSLTFLDDAALAARSDTAQAYLRSVRTGWLGGQELQLPSTNMNVSDFTICYQSYSLLRKFRDEAFVTPVSESALVQKAVSGLLKTEERCRFVNKAGYVPFCATEGNPSPEQVIFLARQRIAQILSHDFPLNEFAASIGFSSGASTRLPRKRGAVPYKFQGKPHVTRSCALLAINLIWFHEPWRRYCQDRFGRQSDPFSWVKVVRGSEYFTVPKTATSLRGAAKEPELNMLCQKAIGSMIRKRLRRSGIDLNDQSVNKNLALAGSVDGSLATIDLSAASDSVSLRLLELLPPEWARFISMTRSEEIKLPDGTWHKLEMVSSMGNGFTFELESLIFYSLAWASTVLKSKDRRIGTYGDDLIVPTGAATTLISALEYLGFAVNEEKSFVSGPFRESCGGHYFLGCDVTPFYLRGEVKTDGDRYLCLNSFRTWLYAFQDSSFRKSQRRWEQLLLPKRPHFTPPHMGLRAGLIPPSVTQCAGIYFCLKRQGYVTRALLERVPNTHVDGDHGYLAWHMQSSGVVNVKKVDGKTLLRVHPLVTSEWSNACVRSG